MLMTQSVALFLIAGLFETGLSGMRLNQEEMKRKGAAQWRAGVIPARRQTSLRHS